MTDPLDIAIIGKFAEELGECSAIVARCMIAGMEEINPANGLTNIECLKREMADVIAGLAIVGAHFKIKEPELTQRAERKVAFLNRWHKSLPTKSTGS